MYQEQMTDYLNKLSELMLATQVTDEGNTSLSLNQGAAKVVDLILEVRSGSGKIILVGNGGSSAIVSHVQNDLCKAVGARAIVFTEQPLLTALTNDHGYDYAYEHCTELWAEPGDLFVAVSSSGKSENILRAARAALNRGCRLVTLTGFDSANPLRQMGTLNFYVNSDVYGYVETAHAALTHFMTDKAMMLVREHSQTRATA